MLRNIVEEARFERERDAIDDDVQRMDTLLLGATFVLARKPEEGTATRTAGIYAVTLQGWNGLALVIFYRFDAQCVYLLSVVRSGEQGIFTGGAGEDVQRERERAPGEEGSAEAS